MALHYIALYCIVIFAVKLAKSCDWKLNLAISHNPLATTLQDYLKHHLIYLES